MAYLVKLVNRGLNRTPVIGRKTITTTPAEVFARSKPLNGRYQMNVDNIGEDYVYLYDPEEGTKKSIRPGDEVVINFTDPTVPIYMVADTSVVVEVVELA